MPFSSNKYVDLNKINAQICAAIWMSLLFIAYTDVKKERLQDAESLPSFTIFTWM